MSKSIELNSIWKKISSEECIIQNKSRNDVYVMYSDIVPEDGVKDAFILSYGKILNFPKPLSGDIYACSTNTANIIVAEI
jgi:hypothetical protein